MEDTRWTTTIGPVRSTRDCPSRLHLGTSDEVERRKEQPVGRWKKRNYGHHIIALPLSRQRLGQPSDDPPGPLVSLFLPVLAPLLPRCRGYMIETDGAVYLVGNDDRRIWQQRGVVGGKVVRTDIYARPPKRAPLIPRGPVFIFPGMAVAK